MCTLEDILVFFTGTSRVPPLGFDRRPSIVFLHDPTAILVSEHCGQLKFHLLSTSNCAIKASLAIVSKYRNLKTHSQHFFSVKILNSVRKNEVTCQHIRFSFIHFYPKKCLALSADPIVIFYFLPTIAKQIEFSSFIF